MPYFQVHIDLLMIAAQLTESLTGRYHDDKHKVDELTSFIEDITERVPVPDDTEFVRRMAEYFAGKLKELDGLG